MGVFAITGGSASYKQVLSVSCIRVSSGPSPGPSTPLINYFMASDTNVTSLAGIGNAIAEKGFVAGFFSAIDLTIFLGLFVLAIGLGVLYRRRTPPIFLGLCAVYLVIAVVVGAVRPPLLEVRRCPLGRKSSSASSRSSCSAAPSPATSG